MLWAISGGAGFLGLHLARRLLAEGHEVRSLDVVPLDDAQLEGEIHELRGDIRNPESASSLVEGAEVLVHAAAALPIRGSAREIRSVNVEGTATLLGAALEAGVRRTLLVSSTAVYGVPETHPVDETAPPATSCSPSRTWSTRSSSPPRPTSPARRSTWAPPSSARSARTSRP